MQRFSLFMLFDGGSDIDGDDGDLFLIQMSVVMLLYSVLSLILRPNR